MIKLSKNLWRFPGRSWIFYFINQITRYVSGNGKPPGSPTRLLEHYGAFYFEGEVIKKRDELRGRISNDLLKHVSRQGENHGS